MKLIFLLFGVCLATPPACFLSCISEVARQCPGEHSDIRCICNKRDSVIGCLVDICPYGTFESSRDHFLGTCLEHQRDHYNPPHLPPLVMHPATKSSAAVTTASPSPELTTVPESSSTLYHITLPHQRLKIVRKQKSDPESAPELVYDLTNGRSRQSRPLPPGRRLDELNYSKEKERLESAFDHNKKLLRRMIQ